MYRFHRYNLIRWDISSPSVAYKLFVRGLYDYAIVKEETSSGVTTRGYFVAAKGLETSWNNRASLTYSSDIKGRKLVNEGQNWLLANTGGEVFSGLLDEYGGAAAAYSLRKLSSSYSGDAIVVRRSSDNATQNIGFIENELDTTTLNSFCSGANGFITTWYDQSGNGNNSTNATASEQPKIYDASTGVILENGKPAVSFDGVDDRLGTDIIPDENQPFTAFFIRKYLNVSGGTFVGLSVDSSASTGYAEISFFGQFRSFYNTYLGSFTSNTLQGLWYSLGNSTSSEIGLDGQTAIVGNAGTNGLEVINIGSAHTSFFANINVQEVIIYNSNQSSNRTGIETNINDFYNIY